LENQHARGHSGLFHARRAKCGPRSETISADHYSHDIFRPNSAGLGNCVASI
jgi:hypothetical protein